MDKSRLVLVPTDFSDESFAALEYAVYYANRTDAQIRLLHIAEKDELRNKVESTSAYKERILEVQESLRNFKNRSGGGFRIQSDLIISNDPVSEIILQYAANLHIELCCLGTSGKRSEGSKSGLGANTEKLIKEAAFPILSCRKHPSAIQFKNILLPIDLTQHTNEKVERIILFARTFNSTIHLLAVSEFLEEFTFSRKELLERLEEAAGFIRSEGIKCYTEVIRYDYVSKSVTDYAEEIHADLLVVMAEQQALISEFIFGSRTNRVVAQSPIPVMSFRPMQ
jgi:nucleotide-binding universal stress UspA family protein